MVLKLSIIISNLKKYHYFIYNLKTQSISKMLSDEHTIDIKKFQKKLKNKDDKYIVIRVKLNPITKKQHMMEKKSPLKLLGGPLYGEVYEYDIINVNKSYKLKKRKPRVKNKIFFPKKYLSENNIQINDIKKIALAYTKNKLNNSLAAINTIKNINYDN